jgi:helix-turn-helix protein
MSEIQHTMPRSRRQAVSVEPLAVSPKMAMQLLSLGETRTYALLKSGELQSYRDGGARRILMSSITDYIKRRLEDTNSKPSRRRPGRPRKTAAASS